MFADIGPPPKDFAWTFWSRHLPFRNESEAHVADCISCFHVFWGRGIAFVQCIAGQKRFPSNSLQCCMLVTRILGRVEMLVAR